MPSNFMSMEDEIGSSPRRALGFGLFTIGLVTGLVSGFVGLLLSA